MKDTKTPKSKTDTPQQTDWQTWQHNSPFFTTGYMFIHFEHVPEVYTPHTLTRIKFHLGPVTCVIFSLLSAAHAVSYILLQEMKNVQINIHQKAETPAQLILLLSQKCLKSAEVFKHNKIKLLEVWFFLKFLQWLSTAQQQQTGFLT